MKKSFLFFFCLFLAFPQTRANDISKLYNTYLSVEGKQQINIGNQLLDEAFRKDLIDSLGHFKKHDDEMKMWIHYAVASWAWELHQVKNIAAPANEALQLSIKLNDLAMQGDCYHLLGAACQMQGDVFHAIEYFEKGYEADRLLNDPDRMSSSLNNLAGNYLSTEQVDQAEKYILRAIDLERNMKRPDKLAIRLGMASDIYLKLNKPQAALPYITEAFELDSIGNRPIKMAVRLSQRASVYEAMERYNDAKRSLLQALSIFAGTTHTRSTAICYNQLGKLALQEEQLLQAEEYYGNAVNLSRQCGDIYTESKAARGLAEALKTKNPEQALVMLDRYVQLSDTIFSEQMAQKLSMFQAKYNQNESEHKAIIEEHQSQFQTTLLILVGIVLCLLVILGYLYYIHHHRKALPTITPAKEDHAIGRETNKEETESQELRSIALTNREKQILQLCCKGLQDKEIAQLLYISERTVNTHKSNIFRKCGVNNTVELVRFAFTNNLVID